MKRAINQWAAEDRPRERMMRHGAATLSTAELLAILVGSGNTDESAVELMRKVFDDYHQSIQLLGKATIDELCRYKGIGPAKAVTIAAALELTRRRETNPIERPVITDSRALYEYFLPIMADLPIEECWVALLNQSKKVIDCVKISSGGLVSTAVDVRVVLREAIMHRATAMALCHNHPSGNVRPSRDDDHLTDQLRRASQVMNIVLVDHIVITDGNYYSYADNDKL